MTQDEEIKLVGEAHRGSRAKEWLASPLYKEATEKIESGIIEKFKASPIRDLDGQHELRLLLKLLEDLKGYIQEVAETGKMAQITLDSERSLKERAKSAVRAFRRN